MHGITNYIYILHDIGKAPDLFAVASTTVVLYSTLVLNSCWSKLVADARMSAYISPLRFSLLVPNSILTRQEVRTRRVELERILVHDDRGRIPRISGSACAG
jgi:hypothetical protein